MSDQETQLSDLPKVEKELVESRREVANVGMKLSNLEQENQKLVAEIDRLRKENEIFRRALLEIEAEKSTIAYNQLGSALKIKMLLQEPAV